MPGRPRREYVSLVARMEQKREARVGLRRRLNLVPPAPPARAPERRRIDAWGQQFYVTQLTSGEFTAYNAIPWTYSMSTALGTMATTFTNLGNAVTSAATTISGNWNIRGTPVTMAPGSIVTYDLPRNNERFFTPPVVPLTPEEEEARIQRRLQAEERRQEAHRRRTYAEGRARDFLREFLNPEQRADYDENEYFYVEGSAGNLYRIDRGNAGNVYYVDRATRRELASICAHPTMREQWLPNQDVALVQKIALETDEPLFTAIANVHWGIRPPHADMERRPGINTPPGSRLHVAGPLVAA